MILVTGATGNVGKPLVEALVAAGEEARAVSRRDGVDLTAPDSLPLDGVDAVFLMTPAEFLAKGDIDAVMKVVREAEVKRVVLLSSQGVGTGRHPQHLEDAVKRIANWTMLRPGNFDSNALQWAPSVRSERLVGAPFGDVALPAVDPADIAEVAAAALLEDGHANGVYTLTGPEPISPRQQAEVIAAALGEPVRFVEQSREEARSQMLRFMPEPVVETTLDLLGMPTAEEQSVSPDVERLLGRPPRAFAEWVARSVAAFR